MYKLCILHLCSTSLRRRSTCMSACVVGGFNSYIFDASSKGKEAEATIPASTKKTSGKLYSAL